MPNGKKIILAPILPIIDGKNKKCCSCGEKAICVNRDGKYLCGKQVCIFPNI